MRKLFLALFMALFVATPSFAFNDPEVQGLKEESNGTAADGVRVYRLVRNPITKAAGLPGPNGTMNSGDAVLWDTVSDDGVTVNYPSQLGITTSTDALAGVLVTSIPTIDAVTTAAGALGKANWGYIQIYGKCYVSFDALGGGAVVGQGFRASLSDGNVVNAHSNGAGGSFGFAYDTAASGGTGVEVFVHTR